MKRNIVATTEGSSCENDDSHAMSPQFSTVELSIQFHLNQQKVWAEKVTKRLKTVTRRLKTFVNEAMKYAHGNL